RNGAVLTNIRSRVYDVDFDIFAIPLAKTPSDEEAYQELSVIYRYMLGEENYRQHVSMEYENN
ncbi:MAG: N-acetyltransferase, partial [Lachnospiraceae bacterium]|nr:N-acetyltransferase [Lachnospiraceae bacterium]